MNKIKYIFKRLKKMDYLSFFDTIKRIHLKTGKNSFILFCDIIYCGFKYMAGYVDYEVFEFYNIDNKIRKTIITRGINNKFVKELNNKEYFDCIDNKILFNEKYSKFLKRDWLDLRKASLEDFEKFVKDKKIVMAKTIDLCCGKGIEKITCEENMDLSNLYMVLKNNKQFLIEEYVVQHDYLNKTHPYTNTPIIGYKIPMFNEAVAFAKELALVTPQIKYTAWDISVTNNGPVVIEGNPFPGHDVYFSKLNVQKKKAGLLPTFQEVLAN